MPEHLQAPILDAVKKAAAKAKLAADKATDAQIARDDVIRDAMNSGVTVTELARALDMNRSRLYQILNASK